MINNCRKGGPTKNPKINNRGGGRILFGTYRQERYFETGSVKSIFAIGLP